jgi:hypothetical protein
MKGSKLVLNRKNVKELGFLIPLMVLILSCVAFADGTGDNGGGVHMVPMGPTPEIPITYVWDPTVRKCEMFGDGGFMGYVPRIPYCMRHFLGVSYEQNGRSEGDVRASNLEQKGALVPVGAIDSTGSDAPAKSAI